MIFVAEAEIRWLDHCESKAIQTSRRRRDESVAEEPKVVQEA